MNAEVVHIAGARPNFPKLAPVHRHLAELGVAQVLIHTGQHYDDRMSDVFFDQLSLPVPDVNLDVGSGTHAAQTAAVLVGVETYLQSSRPKLVIVYGDVNSTLAGALAAVKLGIPVAHVEAGLRSGDMSMPEEVNRKLTDQIADLLFTTSPEAAGNLAAEGVGSYKVHFVGNPMIDTLFTVKDSLDAKAILTRLGVESPYVVATLHRPSNVDSFTDAKRVIEVLKLASSHAHVVLPLHPRGRGSLESAGLAEVPNLTLCEPLSYVEFISLMSASLAVVTDSGGVQEETTMLQVPCLTLRETTERPVTITHGTNRLVTAEEFDDAIAAAIVQARSSTVAGADSSTPSAASEPPPLWDGRAGERIARIVKDWLTR